MLLDVMAFFSNVSKWFAEHWGEIIATFGGTTGIIYLSKLITNLIIAKIKKKNNVPINEELTIINDKMIALKTQMDTITQSLNELPAIIKNSVKNGINSIQKAKQEAYAKLCNLKGKVINVLEDEKSISDKVETISNLAKDNVNELKEDTKEVLNTINPIKQEIKNTEDVIKVVVNE